MNTLEYLRLNKIKVNPIFTQMFTIHTDVKNREEALHSLNTYLVSICFENLIKSLTDDIHYKLDEWYLAHMVEYSLLASEMGLVDMAMTTYQRIQAMQYAKYKTELTALLDRLIIAVELLEAG